ncbi:MAG TPA: Uma2 family endonuclease [Polyangiales bacterium]
MSQPARRLDPYAEWLALPSHVVGEVIAGQLHVQPRPALRHAHASSVLGEELGPPFRRGRGGPGGWILLDEPELHLGTRPDILVPDLAGWRRERIPELPAAAYCTISPDWVCEVLSPATQRTDRAEKREIYRRESVHHLWFLDPDAHTLEVFRLAGGAYVLVATHAGDAPVRAEPFDAIELELALLWQP